MPSQSGSARSENFQFQRALRRSVALWDFTLPGDVDSALGLRVSRNTLINRKPSKMRTLVCIHRENQAFFNG